MKVLVLGSSSREHANIWKLVQSAKYQNLEILAIPGNPMIADEFECLDADLNDIDRLVEIAIARNIGLTIVGESELFSQGIVDKFEAAGKPILGPDQAAAELERSYSYFKEVLHKNEIPTANYVSFSNEIMAKAFASTMNFPIQISFDDTFTQTNSELQVQNTAHDIEMAHALITEIYSQGSSTKVVLEEQDLGYETYRIPTIWDGERCLSLTPTHIYQNVESDFEILQEDMGAYAPCPIINDEVMAEVRSKILDPLVKAYEKEKRPYKGVLSLEIGIKRNGDGSPIALRLFNISSNFSLSEAQVALQLLDEELFDVYASSARGNLSFYEEGFHRYPIYALCINIFTESSSFSKSNSFVDQSIELFKERFNISNNSANPISKEDTAYLRQQLVELSAGLNAKPQVFYDAHKHSQQGTSVLGANAIAHNLVDAQHLAYKLAESIDIPEKNYLRNIGDTGLID